MRAAELPDAMSPAGPLTEGETAMHKVVPSNQKQAREIIRLKDQLVKARKMSAAGTFCLSLIPDIHDRVADACQKLAAPTKEVDPQQLKEQLEPVLDGLARIMKATQVIPAPRFEPTDISKVVHRAVEMVKPDTDIHRIKLSLKLAEGLTAQTDPQRLVVALTEFLKSAIRSGQSGAMVSIVGDKNADGVLLTISNQNQEISADGLLRVFDPFVTSDVHWQRLGMGIFEARQIIMSFGGTVTLESTEGLGTSVDIVLPVS